VDREANDVPRSPDDGTQIGFMDRER
jgi:hypothetical protein